MSVYALRRMTRLPLQLALIGCIVAVSGGCDSTPTSTPTPPPTPDVTIRMNPEVTEVPVGGAVAIAAESSGAAKMTISWSAERGRLSRLEGPSVIYTAPDDPGLDMVDVTVVADGGATTRTVTFTVVLRTPEPPPEPPTPTATPCPLVSVRPLIVGPEVGDLVVQITRPAHCSRGLPMGTGFEGGGTYSGNLADRELWVLVCPSDLRCYPQTPNACDELPAEASNGTWRTSFTLGREGVPEQIDIVLTVTEEGSEASQVFKEWLRTGCDSGDFPGFYRRELPSGLTELHAITVHTGE